MTKEDFILKYRPHLMGYLAECYASRSAAPSSFGQIVDAQFSRLNGILGAMHKDLIPETAVPPPNGAVQKEQVKR